jgi:biopolymer transport protein ExbD
MRLPDTSQNGGMPINMTPMIDVVFQLIVFFTATSTIAKNEIGPSVELPVAEKGIDRDQASQKKRITANVVADGVVSIAGRSVDAAAFRQILEAELSERPAGQIEIELRGDRAAPYRSVEPLLVECARCGVWQVSFSVKRPEPD